MRHSSTHRWEKKQREKTASSLLCHTSSCFAMPCHTSVTLCHTSSCFAILRHDLPCLAMICHALPCLAMLCHALWNFVRSRAKTPYPAEHIEHLLSGTILSGTILKRRSRGTTVELKMDVT